MIKNKCKAGKNQKLTFELNFVEKFWGKHRHILMFSLDLCSTASFEFIIRISLSLILKSENISFFLS